MLKILLQLFGGRGAGSGNKGSGGSGSGGGGDGEGGGKSYFGGVSPSGPNGTYTFGDLVASGKTYKADSQTLYDKGDSRVVHLIHRLYDKRVQSGHGDPTAIRFVSHDPDTGRVTVKVKWADGRVSNVTVGTHKNK